MKKAIKKILRPLYFNVKQLYYQISGKPRAKGFIFVLHRVAEWDEGKIFWNENMKVSPSKLDYLLTFFQQKYNIIRLEEVPAYLHSQQKRKFVVFTIDDGYKDNLTDALPIFKKHNVPFTIFLSSDFMDRKAILWWYVLEDLILNSQSLRLSNGKNFICNTLEEKERSFLDIRNEILSIDQQHLEEGLNNLFVGYNIDWHSKCEELCMSWSDVNRLTSEPLVTLGAHTQHHYNLEMLETKDDIRTEILTGYKRIKDETGANLPVFSYPFGLAGEREFSVLSDMNEVFELAVTTFYCAVTNDNANCYSFPRIMLEESFDELSLKRINNCCVI